jgi:hypothetical protein
MATPAKGPPAPTRGEQVVAAKIARWGRSKTCISIVKWRRALIVLTSNVGNDVATIARVDLDRHVSLRVLTKKAQHRGSVSYRGHNACETRRAKVAVTGLARR